MNNKTHNIHSAGNALRKFSLFLAAVIFTASAAFCAENEAQNAGENGSPEIDFTKLSASGEEQRDYILGSVQKDSPYQFELQLTNEGASIKYARLNGYYKRGSEEDPFLALAPVSRLEAGKAYSLKNTYLWFKGIPGRFPLGKLNWKAGQVRRNDKGSESISFTAVLSSEGFGEVLKIKKTYLLMPEKQHFEVYFTLQNLSDQVLKPIFQVHGPVGFIREGVRMDGRSIVSAFYEGEEGDKIKSSKIELKTARKAEIDYMNTGIEKELEDVQIKAPKGAGKFNWIANGNKYFTCILKPICKDCRVLPGRARYYDSKLIKGKSEGDQPNTNGTESLAYLLKFDDITLQPAGSKNSKQIIKMITYLGPKEKSIFENEPIYKKLHFIHAIDFRACCGNLFRPITFAILAFMNFCYGFIPNYGIIIIILVFLVRLILHPLTKKGQVSMMKMSKLGPQVEEIKKKYKDTPKEMNQHVMQLYKDQGASPMLGFVPMLIQMPIWVSLYSAIYSSVDLRGAGFLPFWITDLSAPDALIAFDPFTIPFIGIEIGSFNLLPLLLSVALFMQQKLMSAAQPGATSPEVAQQQKIMRIMMPILMLVFLYKAPSGLNLYIMASSFGGVLEQKVIRKHIKDQEDNDKRVVVPANRKGGKKRKPKPKQY
ncbi:membrane protein insertase YidC [Sedimentisphaera salicampi]|uniref:Membrane protein insertase YidC n=1 Tax=Sedimentisphaera salicampi TaxID=1941349 RepID=A0A1W6LQ18_9BACT|nr:membrane protein insertase YidC [Sedimentisphaera salicampi]ARN57870.1 Oxa1Ec [Sedimentisphaera salicampi]OXU14038.1 Oxa1Ec [Sedimentisphaera salicampi]